MAKTAKPKIKFVNGKEYTLPKVTVGIWRKLLKFQNEELDISTVEGYEELQELLIKIFGSQFTMEELEDGLPLEDWIPTITEVINYINDSLSKFAGEGDGGKK